MSDSDYKIDARLRELENKVDVGFAALEQLISAIRDEAEAERSRAKMRRWTLIIWLCGGASGAMQALLMNSLRH